MLFIPLALSCDELILWRICMATKSVYYLHHIRLSACISAALSGTISMKFGIDDFFKTLSRIFAFC
jgi:hypothetical protein